MRCCSPVRIIALVGTLGSPLFATTPLRQTLAPQAPRTLIVAPEFSGAAKQIPILALYSIERLTTAGGVSALRDELYLELDELNYSLRVSGLLDYEFVFSGIQEAGYHESGLLMNDITWLGDNWPHARILASGGAKMAHLFVSYATDWGGLGTQGPDGTGWWSATVRPSGPGSYIFAHEIGHNLGLQHDPAHAPSGVHWQNAMAFRMAGYRDVMAYEQSCSDEFGSAGCPLFPGFSDPGRTRDGHQLGIAGVSEAVSVLRVSLPYVAGETTCATATKELCLNDSRFRVTASWSTGSAVGAAFAIPRTSDSGEFWFFASTNIELLVKVLNGCDLNDRFWFFAAGLTDVEVTLHVVDTVTGAYRDYVNLRGTAFRPIQDTAAFPCSN